MLPLPTFFVATLSVLSDNAFFAKRNVHYTEFGAFGYAAMFGVGGGLIIASVPMFILSNKNKAKAKKVSVGFTPMRVPGGESTAGLSLALSF